jgi:hypothetical protein
MAVINRSIKWRHMDVETLTRNDNSPMSICLVLTAMKPSTHRMIFRWKFYTAREFPNKYLPLPKISIFITHIIELMSYFSCPRTAVEPLEILVALKLRFIDKRRILIMSHTELLADGLHRCTILSQVGHEGASNSHFRFYPASEI